ncbi:MAG: response regulator transcription factor [Gammaproteobacteria bacterium]|nr:response regulator transcription factor [Gammaproteobacteria bacterium]NIR83473.1 response regulator transcription factor [Gammaproteobacteria bacterium]NIR91395.1 response regulator transcription factor [Gammaproteobacteria bacterium]NIU04635.1 response regulator transcription factor [Gammaproteobacteria bacterium]NIV51677.1 response regulator [Gammaproteobacteria bacterium]
MRVLLVEDDTTLAAELRQRLGRCGFVVDAASNGVDGEHLGEVEPYDAVVLDLGLPDRNGLDILRNWRKRGVNVPVVILTARDAWHEKVDGLKAGADDYLTKPFHVEELIERIRAVVRRRFGQAAAVIEAAGLKLDEERQSAIAPDGRELALTGTEFRLLRYFMLNPDRVLSKRRLAEHVYDYGSEKDSNVIEVYVKRLRHKLGTEFIRTRRGQGYIFGAKS